jgi:hypothetical protein
MAARIRWGANRRFRVATEFFEFARLAKTPVSTNNTLSSKLISAAFFHSCAHAMRLARYINHSTALPTLRIFLAEHDNLYT